jgi:Tfp pilus assembly pilus retraction ATPase PilT
VISTAHAENATGIIERAINMLEPHEQNQIRSQLQSGADDFSSITLALAELCQNGVIAYEIGLVYLNDGNFYQELIHLSGQRR